MAIRFSASTQYLARTANLPSVGSYTIAGWFNRRGTGAGTYETVFGLCGASSGYNLLYCRNSSTANFRVDSSSPASSSNIVACTNDTWYYCAMVGSGTGASGLTGRVSAASSATFSSQTITNSSFTPSNIRLGQNTLFTEWANGSLAFVKLWDAALTETELLQEKWSAKPVRVTNLNFWTPLWHSALADNLTDYSGNGRNWTQGGTPTIENGPPISWGGRPIIIVGQAAAGTDTAISSGAGSLVLTGVAPNAIVNNQVAATSLGALTIAGQSPTVGTTHVTQTALGALTIAGQAPTISVTANTNVATDVGALTIAGNAPTVAVTVATQTGVGALTIAGQAPTAVVNNVNTTTALGALTVNGQAPTIQVSAQNTVNTDVGVLTIAGQAPTVKTTHVTQTDVGSLSIAGYAPTLFIGGPQFVSTDVGQIVLTGYEPTVSGGEAIALEERPAGGYSRTKRKRILGPHLPTPKEIREQREALGILPKRAQKIIRTEVRRITEGVDTPEQAALLASAYTQEAQQDRLKARLKSESDAANLRWRNEMAAIANALILGELARRADDELLDQLMAAEAQERAEVGELLQIWMNL